MKNSNKVYSTSKLTWLALVPVFAFGFTVGAPFTAPQIAKLANENGETSDFSGGSVAMSGTTAVLGARQRDENGRNAGAANLSDTTNGQQLPKPLVVDEPILPAAESARGLDTPQTHNETVRGDKYIAAPRENRAKTRAFRGVQNGFVSVQVNVDANGNNIVGDAANEPSIAVDPNDRNRMAIGWRQFDTIQSNFRQAGWGYSSDGGQTWTFPGVIEPGIFRSDPVLDADADGNFYYNSLTLQGNDYSCNVFVSLDGGETWDDGVYAFGGDKQWMTIDRTGGIGHGNIYANWTRFFSTCNGQATLSWNNGGSFEGCFDVPGEPQWGTMAVGPDGAVYIVGRGFVVAKSSTLQDSNEPIAFEFFRDIDMNGNIEFGEGPNPGGLLGQTWIAVDHSGGDTHNNVYVLGSVNPPGGDPLDVHFARSTDGGLTWSDPVRVNDVRTGWQWFGVMSVAPNGRIDVIWLDTRDDPGGFDSVLYYSSSTDAGDTWSAGVAISPPFDPHLGWPNQNKMGDYYDMVSDNGGANLAYAATFNGEQDVYFVRIGSGTCPGDGTLIEGTGEINDFNATCGSDDSYWAAHGEVFAFQVADPVSQFELIATVPAGLGGNSISVDIEASKESNNANLNLRAQMFNFTSGNYVALPGIMPLATVDAVQHFALPVGSNPADFIDGNSEVNLLLQTIQTSGIPNVRTQLDEVLFNFE